MSDQKPPMLLNIWALIRPGSNISLIYILLILFMINNYMSYTSISPLLYFLQYFILFFIVIICVMCFFYLSNTLLAASYTCSKPAHFNNLSHRLSFYAMRLIIGPFVMIPTFELLFRFITFKFRKLPHFYVLGCNRCGTTTLTHLLDKIGCKGPFSMFNHFVTFNKETQYFSGYLGAALTKPKYFSMCFPLKIIHKLFMKKGTKFYDATPDYLWMPSIHKKIYSVTPNSKIIIMVRNPIQRTQSELQYYAHQIEETEQMFGCKPIDSNANIEQAIKWYHEKDQIVNGYLNAMQTMDINDKVPECAAMLERMCSVHKSMYYRQIQRLLKTFKKQQILIIDVEELNVNLYATLTKIANFIELDVNQKDLVEICGKNQFKCRRNKSFIKWKMSENEEYELYKIFESENEKLFKWLGRDLGWNNKKNT